LVTTSEVARVGVSDGGVIVGTTIAALLERSEITLGLGGLGSSAARSSADSLDDLSLLLLLVLAACLPSRVVGDLGIVVTTIETDSFGEVGEEPGVTGVSSVGGDTARVREGVVLSVSTASRDSVEGEAEVSSNGDHLTARAR
jgi:hypothetical protein